MKTPGSLCTMVVSSGLGIAIAGGGLMPACSDASLGHHEATPGLDASVPFGKGPGSTGGGSPDTGGAPGASGDTDGQAPSGGSSTSTGGAAPGHAQSSSGGSSTGTGGVPGDAPRLTGGSSLGAAGDSGSGGDPNGARGGTPNAGGGPGSGSDAGARSTEDAQADANAPDGATQDCQDAIPLQCGDRLDHSTLVQGRANVWYGYNATQRYLSGRESIYSFQTAAACQVVAQLKNLNNVDLDVLLLSTCGPMSNTEFGNRISFTTEANHPYYIVVDGYSGAAGTYSLEVDCTCP